MDPGKASDHQVQLPDPAGMPGKIDLTRNLLNQGLDDRQLVHICVTNWLSSRFS